MFSCALERNTKYPMWLYITYYQVYKNGNGDETMLLGSVPLSDPKYDKDNYYRKEMINKKIGMQVGSQEELNYCLEHLLIKQNNRENIKKQLSRIQEEGKISIKRSYDEIMKYIL